MGRKVSSEELRSRLQRTLDEFIFQGITGATMAVGVPGYEDMLFASGVADLEKARPMQPTHLLKIASNTKMFVAAVLLQLAREGRVDLDETVSKWFPNLPNSKFITVRQVATHQSGIPDFFDTYELVGNPPPDSVWTVEETIQHGYDLHPVKAPGAYEYSNTNFLLLGLLIEKITGRTRAEEVRHRLLAPLGLKDTFTASSEEFPEERLARGYAHDSGHPADVTHLYPIALAGAAGDMVSSASDCLQWLKAIFGGRVIQEPCLSLFTSRQVEGGMENLAVTGNGIGSMIYSFRDLETVGYAGGIQGYISLMGRHLDSGIDAVILTNSYHSDFTSHHLVGIERPFESAIRTSLAALR